MAVDFQISTGSTVPIYRQIIDQVRRGLTNGDLAIGDRLPSVRALAERLVINPNTVGRAYQELGRDGLIESRHGRGSFIIRPRQIFTRTERTRRLDAALDALVSEVLTLDFSHDELRAALDRKLRKLGGQQRKVTAAK